jgi:predicted O-methyltransferase YrrM
MARTPKQSEDSIVQLDKANAYISSLYTAKTDLTRKQYASATELKDFIPTVDDDVARFLRLLLHLIRARRVLEIGTSIGYSTTSMAQVIKNYQGQIVTIEYDEQVARQARLNFERAGVANYIELRLGDAREIVPKLSGEFDLVFLDVDKQLYAPLLADCVRLLRPGGILVAEDTLFPVIELEPKWHHLIAPIEEFNRLVVNQPEVESTILPIGDGVTVAVKR